MTAEQIKKIWEECPKSKDALVAWLKKDMGQTSGIPEVDTHMQTALSNMDQVTMISLGAKSPRFLYDFFDEQGLNIGVRYDYSDGWTYFIDGTNVGEENKGSMSRINAETEAFIRTFEFLEFKLND